MASTTINTRIQNKVDTLSNWTTNNPVLLNGEIAFVVIPEQETVDGIIPPATVYKIGDGTKTFTELSWGQSVSADVYAWAKAKTKPTYQATEIQGLDDYISGKIEDTNTKYSFSISGNIITIKKKDVTDSDFVDYQTITLPEPDLSGYAEKVASATNGNLAGLNADGNLTDSGIAATSIATKTYVDDAIGDITQMDYQVVESLPESGVKGTIYLVQKTSGSGSQNIYDEYMWLDDKWEKIGDTEIDLSGYATKEEVNAKVSGLASGTTAGHVVTWGADGYTVADSGFTIAKSVPADAVFTDTGITSVVANDGLTQSVSDRQLTLGISSVDAKLLTQTSGDYLILNCGNSSTNV